MLHCHAFVHHAYLYMHCFVFVLILLLCLWFVCVKIQNHIKCRKSKSLKIYLQQSHGFQDVSHRDIGAWKTSNARKCTKPLAQRYKAKQVLRQNSTTSIKLFDFLHFMWFWIFTHTNQRHKSKIKTKTKQCI